MLSNNQFICNVKLTIHYRRYPQSTVFESTSLFVTDASKCFLDHSGHLLVPQNKFKFVRALARATE